MWKLVEFDNHYQVLKEDGIYLSTFTSNNEIEPFKWEKEYHSVEKVAEIVRNIWGMKVF